MSTAIGERHRTPTCVGQDRDRAAFPGIVPVLNGRRYRPRSICTCGGGTSGPRLRRSRGGRDALPHAARAGGLPVGPLDVDVGRRS